MPPRSSLYSAAFLILALSGVGLLWRGPGDVVGTPTAVTAEYCNEARTLTLAPGWHWQTSFHFLPDTSYGRGQGTIWADDRWFCSWESRAVSPGISAKARREALGQLLEFRKTYDYTHMLPEGRARVDARLAQAVHGKLAAVRADASQCRGANP